MCLLCCAALHLHANSGDRVVSLSLIDLSSSFIPFDDEEEEEEETYDDIDGVNAPPSPQAGTARVSQTGRGEWRSSQGGQETGEVDEEDEDIYEVLPGTRIWLPYTQRWRSRQPRR